jgi:hypothetical protein
MSQEAYEARIQLANQRLADLRLRGSQTSYVSRGSAIQNHIFRRYSILSLGEKIGDIDDLKRAGMTYGSRALVAFGSIGDNNNVIGIPSIGTSRFELHNDLALSLLDIPNFKSLPETDGALSGFVVDIKERQLIVLDKYHLKYSDATMLALSRTAKKLIDTEVWLFEGKEKGERIN